MAAAQDHGARANPPAAPSHHEAVAIIAGGGKTPVFLAERLRERKVPLFVAMLEGDADAALKAHDHMIVNVATPGRLMAALQKRNIKTVVLLGSVKGRPDISQFRPNPTTLRFLSRLLPALRQGDDALLRAVIDMIERSGFLVKGAHEIVPDLLAPIGTLGRHRVSAKAQETLTCAVRAADMLGALDAGQAVIAIGHRIVALEGAEGTDAMIERVAHLRSVGRLSQKPGGVLVKLRKPDQEMRVDLPTIGPDTVDRAIAAKLDGIAVHGENSLIVQRTEAVRNADAAGLFLVGIDPDNLNLGQEA